MSPRYGQGIQQQQSPNMGQMMGANNPQVSPNYPQQQQQQQQQQWNMRQQQAMQGQGAMGMQPQVLGFTLYKNFSIENWPKFPKLITGFVKWTDHWAIVDL